MTYKYLYRIDFMRDTGDGKEERGSILMQTRNSTLDREMFHNIRRHIDLEMGINRPSTVRAYIRRLKGEFTDRVYSLSESDGLLIAIYAETRYSFFTHRHWADFTTGEGRFCNVWTDELHKEG